LRRATAPDRPAPPPPRLRNRAERDLLDLGVTVRPDSVVVGVDSQGISLDGRAGHERIDARTVIWSAGVAASPLAAVLAHAAGAELDRAGRVQVAPELSVVGHPEVFAIGDMAAVPEVPGLAPAAIQEGAYVAKVVTARLAGKRAPRPFRYRDRGVMATIGRRRAVAKLFRIELRGLPAFLTWGAVHLAYLVGWGNRVGAISRWLWTVLARNRRERLISVVSLVGETQARAELDSLLGEPSSDRHAGVARDGARDAASSASVRTSLTRGRPNGSPVLRSY
jgi:NADH:ubiquinone reductase (H+-translocating)